MDIQQEEREYQALQVWRKGKRGKSAQGRTLRRRVLVTLLRPLPASVQVQAWTWVDAMGDVAASFPSGVHFLVLGASLAFLPNAIDLAFETMPPSPFSPPEVGIDHLVGTSWQILSSPYLRLGGMCCGFLGLFLFMVRGR